MTTLTSTLSQSWLTLLQWITTEGLPRSQLLSLFFFVSNNLCCERNMIQNSFDITCSIDLPTWAFHCASYFWRWKLLQQNRNQMGLNNLSYSRMNSICKMWNCPGTQASHAYPPRHQIYAPKNQRNRIQIISSTIATYFL